MQKRTLYIIIGILLAVVLYLLFMPQPASSPTPEDVTVDSPETTAPPVIVEEPISDSTEEPVILGDIVFNGTLVDFIDGKDEFLGSYKLARINDGIEVIAVDLRPLIGYDVTNVASDLGITVGESVTVTGDLEDGVFVVKSLTVGDRD